MNSKPKVIIDTDAGIDDAAAMFMALEAHKKDLIDVIAITTVTGNTSIQNVNMNVFRVLETVQMTHIPVFSGASEGLVNKYVFDKPPFHGLDGFGDVLPDFDLQLLQSKLQKEKAPLALISIVEKFPGEVLVVAIGPLTNLALAINLCPEWTSKLKDLYLFGGNIHGEGNETNSAEFNFVFDPESAKVVLDRSQIPIKIVPWETSFHAVHITLEERLVLGSTNSPSAKLLNTVEANIITSKDEYYVTCDQLCVAWLLQDHVTPVRAGISDLNHDLVTKQKSLSATVELMGHHTRGQMIIDRSKDAKRKNLICLQELDKSLYMEYLKWAFS